MDVLNTHPSLRTTYRVAEESAGHGDEQSAIYLDTTVVSYLTARLSRQLSIARHQAITRAWWNEHRHRHALSVSTVVIDEAAAGSSAESSARLEAIARIKILPFDPVSERLAERLVGGGRLPETARRDAEHVAIAATRAIPLLLTWNCKHLANPFIHRNIVRACDAEGFRCPEICTPEALMRTYSDAKFNPF